MNIIAPITPQKQPYNEYTQSHKEASLLHNHLHHVYASIDSMKGQISMAKLTHNSEV